MRELPGLSLMQPYWSYCHRLSRDEAFWKAQLPSLPSDEAPPPGNTCACSAHALSCVEDLGISSKLAIAYGCGYGRLRILIGLGLPIIHRVSSGNLYCKK